MKYTVEVALSYSCEYNEAGAVALCLHGRDNVERVHAEMFREWFDGVPDAQLHSCICSIVHPENLFEPEQHRSCTNCSYFEGVTSPERYLCGYSDKEFFLDDAELICGCYKPQEAETNG